MLLLSGMDGKWQSHGCLVAIFLAVAVTRQSSHEAAIYNRVARAFSFNTSTRYEAEHVQLRLQSECENKNVAIFVQKNDFLLFPFPRHTY